MPSESRNPYVALTPDHADFALRSFEETPALISTRPLSGEDHIHTKPTRLQSLLSCFHDFVSLNAGLLLVMAASAVFSVVNLAVKLVQNLGEPVSTAELIIVRMGITYICSVAYMLIQKVPDPYLGPKEVRLLLMLRGFTGFIGLFSVYFSLQYLSLADVTVLGFLAPMCTAMTGSFFLKENFTLKEGLASLCSLMGVVLIARPEFLFGSQTDSSPSEEDNRMLAIGVTLLGVIGSTASMTTIRAIGQRAHPMHLLAVFSMQSVIAASIFMIAGRLPVVLPITWEWVGLFAVIGILSFVAQILLTMGFQREQAGRASMALYTQIIFASILERVVFHTTPTFLSLLGTSIIMVSAIYVALAKKNTSNEEKLEGEEDVALEEGLLEASKHRNESSRSSMSEDQM
ncbi:hypothetical protein FB45DRAFT_825652 [Roridomyces roridus]|uniref:EamA domain-containing protein n=1 Tax=Roridomyces roridus TaxID=1738132 RepID=A0AAD7C7K7_9AGAR|nr:hypothetical protein FB45DRAFT_825652 [Roridomyces roridus]